MTLQKQVYEKQAAGVIGELADTSPKRIAPYIVKANSDVKPCIGCAYTLTDKAQELIIGGTGDFVGIAVGPKQYVTESLDSSLLLKDGAIAQICSMGHVYVTSKTDVTPGNIAAFDPATGEIYAYADAEAAATAKHTVIPNAKFVFCEADAKGTAILELNS